MPETRSSFFALLLLILSPFAWAEAPFTLEQVLSFSFPSELVSACHSYRVAWVFDWKGVRNVWVADGPDFVHRARQLTHYASDDGQPIASLRLTSDGKTVVTPQTEINASEGGGQLAVIGGTSLRSLVAGLNRIGLKPPGIIAILQAIKTAGALQADLVVQ